MNKTRTEVILPELRSERVHEISGVSASAFAFLMARKSAILLCGSPRMLAAYHAEAVAQYCDPETMLHVPCPLEVDSLWTAETALQSGCMATVIACLEKSPSLTNFRRLQLAAKTGSSLGLVIVSRPAHSTAAETRWHCTPVPTSQWGEVRIHASLYKNKRGVIGSWVLNVFGETNNLCLDATLAGEPICPQRVAS